MKKFFFFACAIVAATTMNAAEQRLAKNDVIGLKMAEMQNLRIETTRKADAPSLTDAQAAVDGPKKTTTVQATFYDSQYYYTPGMMHAGVSPTGGLYYPILNVPYLDSVVYYNYWTNTVEPAWYLTNSAHTQLESSSQTYVAYYGIGDYYLPEVGEGSQQSVTGDTTYFFRPYSYGEAYAQRAYVASGAKESFNKPAMTLCQMWADTLDGKQQDLWSVGAGSAGKYAYGTNLVISEYRLDTLAQLVRGMNPMKINALYLPIYGQYGDSIGSMLPNGAQVKVELFPIRNGRLFPDEPFATTYFSAADFTPATGYRNSGVVKIVFTEQDEQGATVEVPVFTPDSFGVMFTGFNEQNCNFGIKSDYYCPRANTTYYRNKGTWNTIWSGGGNNIALTFDAYWPFMSDHTYQDFEVPMTWTAPVEGGMALCQDTTESIYLYTNTDFANWTFFAKDTLGNDVDWVEVVTDLTNYTDQDIVEIGFQAQVLPAGVDYRVAEVGVKVDGITYSRIIEQGEEPTALESTTATVKVQKVIENGQVIILRDGKRYNVLGAQE